MNRIYIFTGKGGVGKSTVAAAHAIKSARENQKTLLISTDMAHNLGDIFEVPLGKEPVTVIKNLDLFEVDPNHVMEHDFPDITKSLEKLLSFSELHGPSGFGMIPGMDELFSLLKIADIYEKGLYDRIIVDCAPTGETLSLLKFPELLSWYMEKFFPIGKVALRVLSPISKHLLAVDLPDKKAMNDIEAMYLKLYSLQELLKNRDTTSIRLVTIPEKMVVEETKRNYMYMNLYNFNVDGIYINRILPTELDNAFFGEWLNIQKKYLTQLEDTFGMLPMVKIPWYDEELSGIPGVERLCQNALMGSEVFDAKVINQREHFVQNPTGYLLTLSLPFADKSEITFHQSATDLIIKIGNFKRSIPLPNVLRSYLVTSAKLENGHLLIQFETEDLRHE